MSAPARIPTLGWVAAFGAAAVLFVLAGMFVKNVRRAQQAPLPVLATVPEFSFTAQTGAPVTRVSLLGKLWIADMIFTRCAGPCPVMTDRLSQVQRALANSGDDVRLVSVTVDPAYDQPAVLAKYGARFGADPARWLFLTGAPDAVEKFVTKGMLLGLAKDDAGAPMHAQKFVVVDRAGRIRAYRDLEDPNLVPQLLTDLDTLRREPAR
jgi:protein SCO1/2